jgi:hypothetical protein
MSVELNPAIESLNPESLCYSIYSGLYHHFFNAQDKKDEAHPWGISEGDETSVRLKNTAYGFAETIAGAVAGNGTGGTEGGILLDYLKKTGGNMTGKLIANCGLEAGIGNNRILETFQREETFGLAITGDLEIGGNSLFIGGKQILSYESNTATASINSPYIDFKNSILQLKGELIAGENKESGIYLSPQMLSVKGNEVFHRGNAGLETVDWIMKNGHVAGNLEVEGAAVFSGLLRAFHGVELGSGGKVFLYMDNEQVRVNTFLSFASGYGIKIENIPVLVRVNEKDIQLGAAGGDLLLGNSGTNKIRLQANLMDTDGEYLLLSRYGAAYFPGSLTVRHNYGEILLSSYRNDSDDEGITIHRRLCFGTSTGAYLAGKEDGIAFSSFVEHITPEERQILFYDTLLNYRPSASRYKPFNRISDSLFISTGADFVCFDKPLEAKGHVGIDGSLTRLTDGCLFFSDSRYLLSSTDGIKHYGNACFMENIASEAFSSGFAGSGWAIVHNRTTGNVSATFDELTVRKKMRIYELEVQKMSATNGSLWISDCCCGERVVKLGIKN